MTQPRADRIDVDPGAEQVHGGCVPQSVGAHSLGEQGGSGERRDLGGALDERVDAVAGECPPCLLRNTGASGEPSRRAPSKWRKVSAVRGQSGQTRCLRPLPTKRAARVSARLRSATRKLAASLARAPVLYSRSRRAQSRRPCTRLRSGTASRASTSAFSK